MERKKIGDIIKFNSLITSLEDLFFVGMDRELPNIVNSNKNNNCSFGNIELNIGAGNKRLRTAKELSLDNGWNAETDMIPYNNESVAVIHAYHFLEHINNIVFVLQEFQRVLKVGGVVNIVVPYYSSQMAFQDLDHKRFFTENTWRKLFNNEYYDKNKVEWKFEVGLNVIMGIEERCLALITQLIKEA